MARPTTSSRLFLRNNIYYFRFCLKTPFPKIFNKAEIRISTGSSYRSVALKFAFAMEIFMYELLNRLKKGEAISNLSNSDLINYARIYYSNNIEIINVLSLYKKFDDNTIDDIMKQKMQCIEMLKTNNYEEISSDVDSFVDCNCPNVKGNYYDYLKISNTIAKVMLDLNQIIESRSILDFEKEEMLMRKYETIKYNSSDLENNKKCSIAESGMNFLRNGIKIIKLEDAIVEYIERMVMKENSKEKSHLDISGRLKWLTFVFGKEQIVSDIEYKDMIQFVKTLKHMPARRTLRKQFRDKSLEELLSMDIEGRDKLAIGTINTIIEAISTFFSDCVLNKYMDRNLAVNIGIKDDVADDERRDAFDQEDIAKICDEIRRKIYDFDYEWKYWIFMFAMFSGARITEICQLYVDDLVQIDGIWCVSINKNESNNDDAIKKELKNNSSKRIIPVHPVLVDLGFIDFFSKRRASGCTMLFEGIKKLKKHNLGDKPSEFVNKLINSSGVCSEKKVFHSFRHSFKHMLKTSGVNEELRNALCGHEYKSSSCLNYESKPCVKDLYEAICKIKYEYDFKFLKVNTVM